MVLVHLRLKYWYLRLRYWYLHKLHHLYVPVPGKFLQKNIFQTNIFYGRACLDHSLS